jgi:hypothetical protein
MPRAQAAGEVDERGGASDLGIEPGRIGDVVAVQASRPRLQERRGVAVGDTERVEVVDDRGRVREGELVVELQAVRRSRNPRRRGVVTRRDGSPRRRRVVAVDHPLDVDSAPLVAQPRRQLTDSSATGAGARGTHKKNGAIAPRYGGSPLGSDVTARKAPASRMSRE